MIAQPHLQTDVLVIGAGGAGMYAALAAAAEGANVLLVDKNVVGRGGATVMAQMTVAAALGETEPDSWQAHLADTVQAGRGLCNEDLAEVLCRQGPDRIREMQTWGTGWASEEGRITQVMAPGHDRRRCCYVDYLNTGPAVAATLRKRVARDDRIRRISNVSVVRLLEDAGVVFGAIAVSLADGELRAIHANAVVIATGGLTKLYARTSASANMAGDGFALALWAGAELVDMEFVQFFPIGHLAPRMVGMDPIMWDPFRYKLGGRLLNGEGEEFIHRYGGEDGGKYTATRDLATYAIDREVAAGRGSPNGGAYLSFSHLPEATLRDAFGPVIDRLRANGIDLQNNAVEVAPIAHYHMGGLRVDTSMATTVGRLYGAGEAVGGAAGANRLSGNAITEALVFGEVAGRAAGAKALQEPASWSEAAASAGWDACRSDALEPEDNTPRQYKGLREMMWDQVGAFRDREGLSRAIETIHSLREESTHPPAARTYASQLVDWFEFRAALWSAEAVAVAALAREESRGAHQREDFPETTAAFERNQFVRLTNRGLEASFVNE